MRLESIQTRNFAGTPDLDNRLKPLVVVCGPNESGKTGLRDAIELALTGEPQRVTRKKDLKHLITDGHDDASVTLSYVDADGNSARVERNVKTGNCRTNTPDLPAELALLLDPARIMAMADKERLRLVFRVTGTKLDAAQIKAKLAERGVSEQHVERLGPLLRGGIESAKKEAEDLRAKTKGAWQEVTGEAYGSKKAEAWQPAKPDPVDGDPDEARAQIGMINMRIKSLNERLTLLQGNESMQRRHRELSVKAANRSRLASRLEELEGQSNTLKQQIDDLAQRDAQACPHCEGLLRVSGHAVTALDGKPLTKAEKKKLSELREQHLDMLSDLGDTRNEHSQAQSAFDELADFTGGQGDSEETVDALKRKIDEADQQAQPHRQTIDAHDNRSESLAQAQRNADRAAELHAQVCSLEAAVQGLAPDGIVQELAAKALTPVNEHLAATHKATGWGLATVAEDGSVHRDGRPYGLLSESAQWRVCAALGAALASLTGIKLLALDRIDVNDIPTRSKLIAWAQGLVKRGELETCLLIGTLKHAPVALADKATVLWLPQLATVPHQEAA